MRGSLEVAQASLLLVHDLAPPADEGKNSNHAQLLILDHEHCGPACLTSRVGDTGC
jgi:hypothetical protein